MPRKKITKDVLISFVGTNDRGKLVSGNDGAVLTVFLERKYDEIHLLWTTSNKSGIDYKEIADYVSAEIKKKKFCRNVFLHQFNCKDVTDHNEIYPSLLSFCRQLPTDPSTRYTAAIASGTPAMQVCWILMAESYDFPLKLIRSNEPRFGKPYVRDIVLGTGLPRILHLQEHVEKLVGEKNSLLPDVIMDIRKGEVKIGSVKINLSPIQFSYYRYFLERAKEDKEFERFSGISITKELLSKIIQNHKESFPESELFRDELERMIKNGDLLSMSTFRGNISKTNKSIDISLNNKALSREYIIQRQGKRHSTAYGIILTSDKIKIKKT